MSATFARTDWFGRAPYVNDWNTVASFASHAEAQAAVDHLVAGGFPVGYLEIVGSQLQSVEHVTGPVTAKRSTVAGAGVGATWGLLFGLVVGLFVGSVAAWIGLMLVAVVLGAVYGGLTGVGARWLSRGRHDYASVPTIVAGRYDLIALEGTAIQARTALGMAA